MVVLMSEDTLGIHESENCARECVGCLHREGLWRLLKMADNSC